MSHSILARMLERPAFDHFNLIMNNLDDTALIWVDWGEWGLQLLRVSDDIVENGKWKDTIAKKKTIEEIILKHNFLKSAYDKVYEVGTNTTYYPSIKDMALCNTYDENNGVHIDERDFKEVEHASYALAAFKKSGDITSIQRLLSEHAWQMTLTSFALMKKFPDETYLDVYEKYYRYYFYSKIRREPFGNILTMQKVSLIPLQHIKMNEAL